MLGGASSWITGKSQQPRSFAAAMRRHSNNPALQQRGSVLEYDEKRPGTAQAASLTAQNRFRIERRIGYEGS
jgi:hypothetical protein